MSFDNLSYVHLVGILRIELNVCIHGYIGRFFLVLSFEPGVLRPVDN